MSERDSFRVEGVGCWCDGSMTLNTLRVMGHTVACTQARRGWEANYRRSREIDRQTLRGEPLVQAVEGAEQIRTAVQALSASYNSSSRGEA